MRAAGARTDVRTVACSAGTGQRPIPQAGVGKGARQDNICRERSRFGQAYSRIVSRRLQPDTAAIAGTHCQAAITLFMPAGLCRTHSTGSLRQKSDHYTSMYYTSFPEVTSSMNSLDCSDIIQVAIVAKTGLIMHRYLLLL